MIISPFSPVFFPDGRYADGLDSTFVQFFAKGDSLRIQVIRTSEETAPTCRIDNVSGSVSGTGGGMSASRTVLPVSTDIGGGNRLDSYTVSLTTVGFFTVTVGGHTSEPFEVTDDETAIGRSVLFEYSMGFNDVRTDVVGEVDGEPYYFCFRVPGGFKASGYDFSVDNEQFTAQTSDIVELYARESTQETLTVGWSRGVPVWFGQMLNRLLTCRYVYIDGLRYARYQSSVPEKSQPLEGVNSFVFRQKLQRINHLNPTKP